MRLHDPDDHGIWCTTDDDGERYLPYTDDINLIEQGLGIEQFEAEATLRLQDRPVWQPTSLSAEDFARLTT